MTTQFPFSLVFLYPKGRKLLLHLQWNLSFQMHSQLIKYSNEFGHHHHNFCPGLIYLVFYCSHLLNIRDPNTVRVLWDTSSTSLQTTFHHPRISMHGLNSSCNFRAFLTYLHYLALKEFLHLWWGTVSLKASVSRWYDQSKPLMNWLTVAVVSCPQKSHKTYGLVELTIA